MTIGQHRRQVVIRPRDRLLRGVILFGLLTAVLFAWIVPDIMEMSRRTELVAWLFFVLALIFLAGITLLLLWMMLGSNVLMIDDKTLLIQKRLGRRNLGSPRVFLINDIHNLQLEERVRKAKGNTTVKQQILFEYQGERKILFHDLPPTQAHELLAQLRIWMKAAP